MNSCRRKKAVFSKWKRFYLNLYRNCEENKKITKISEIKWIVDLEGLVCYNNAKAGSMRTVFKVKICYRE